MKIAFLTSCLEAGRDGVGDYMSLLAAECERLGHEARLLALNDPYIDETRAGADAMRLPQRMTWTERFGKAKGFLAEFAPDFVSVQFVCYGFHPRGIDWQLASRLKHIVGESRVQIMFHELWIGAEIGASLKARVIGALQRRGVLQVIRALAPAAVHTSNAAYVAMLRQRGVSTIRLPLFGSVPLIRTEPVPRAETHDSLMFGIFGTLHPVWPPEPLFTQLRGLGKKITIAHAGHLGSGAALWKKIQRDYDGVFEFLTIGVQSPEDLANFFAELDFGIATTPWEIIGKSAAAAAMLEHGLPLIVNRDDAHYRDWSAEGYSPLLIKLGDDLPTRLAAARRGVPRRILPDVARQFLNDLARFVNRNAA